MNASRLTVGLAAIAAASAPACNAIFGVESLTYEGADAQTDGRSTMVDGEAADGAQDAHEAGATPLDGPAGSQDGSADGDSGGDADAGAAECAPNASRCFDARAYQRCGPRGLWGNATACPAVAPYCTTAGACTTTPPSCQQTGPGVSDCGTTSESCCATLLVPQGTFNRGSNASVCGSGADAGEAGTACSAYPATVSGLNVDAYEVTVGRFRPFVNAVVGGWLPTPGSGKHTHLNGGSGLSAAGGGYEAGWSSTWNGNLAATSSAWSTRLACNSTYATWTVSPASNESRPINCVTWYEAYAFCIWDGGFLPSEAEWDYVAAGGSDQRVYPWSSPSSSSSIACSNASYYNGSVYCGANDQGTISDLIFVGNDPMGNGKWGHSDLAGNIEEWNVDFWDGHLPYTNPCTDCAYLSTASGRVLRGGAFDSRAPSLLTSARDNAAPDLQLARAGVRCARIP